MKTATPRAHWDLSASVAGDARLPATAVPVLLLDDDRQSRTVLEVVLAQRGHDVYTCRDRAEFLVRLDDIEHPLLVVGVGGQTTDERAFLEAVIEQATERGLPLLLVGLDPAETAGFEALPPRTATLPRPAPVAALRTALDALADHTAAAAALAAPDPLPTRFDDGDPDMRAELERMREHLASFVQNAPLAVFSLDEHFLIMDWSESARAQLGWDADDVRGRGAEEWPFVDGARRGEVAEQFRAIADDERTRFVITIPARTKDGSAQEIEWYCAVHRGPDGAMRSVTCMGLDVSEQRQAREVLRASEERFRALVQHASDIIAIVDEDAITQYASPAAERVLGYALSDLVGQSILALVHPDDLPQALEHLRKLLRMPGTALELEELRFRHLSGSWRVLELRGANLLSEPEVNGIVLNIRDVTEQQLADEVLRQSEERFRSLVQHSSDMLMVLDGAGNVAYISPAAEQLLAAGAARWLGKYVFEGVHPDDATATRALLERALAAPGSVQAGDFRMRGRDGEWRYLECRMRNLLDEPSVRGIVVNSRDVTERRLAEEASRESEERFRSLVQNASDMVTVITHDGRITYQSPSIERMLGYAPDEVTGHLLSEFLHPEDEPRVRAQLDRLAESERGTVRFELRWRHHNDAYRNIEAVCTNLLGDAGVGGIVINARDVTDRKALERQLTRRAFLDSLTNLPNRLLFMHRLDRALQRAADEPNSVGVLFLDLDRFKIVNDSLGHEIGDQLLVAVGNRLRRIVRPADTVARLGGDEFIVLIEGAQSVDEVIRVAERIIEELHTPIRLNRHEVAVAASVGIAMGENHGVTSQDLLRNADIALYRAKEQGTGGYVVFDASMARQAVQRLALENELRRAVQRNEFGVQYLPEVDLSTNQLAGLEVLTRWNHPERGLVRPAEFMAVAEETGLIVEIGEWTLRQACAQMREWRARRSASKTLFLAVNLTAREFRRPDLVEHITSTLESFDLEPSMLRLEISEAIMVAEPLSTLEKLRRLKQRGVMLAIDDFGSGYSSLSYLTRVSFDTLKIDRQFVSGPGGVTNNLSIVRAVTSLAHALGMNVTAEGVESPEHLTRVRAAGCDHGQGYLFSDALDAMAVEAQLFSPTSS